MEKMKTEFQLLLLRMELSRWDLLCKYMFRS